MKKIIAIVLLLTTTGCMGVGAIGLVGKAAGSIAKTTPKQEVKSVETQTTGPNGEDIQDFSPPYISIKQIPGVKLKDGEWRKMIAGEKIVKGAYVDDKGIKSEVILHIHSLVNGDPRISRIVSWPAKHSPQEEEATSTKKGDGLS